MFPAGHSSINRLIFLYQWIGSQGNSTGIDRCSHDICGFPVILSLTPIHLSQLCSSPVLLTTKAAPQLTVWAGCQPKDFAPNESKNSWSATAMTIFRLSDHEMADLWSSVRFFIKHHKTKKNRFWLNHWTHVQPTKKSWNLCKSQGSSTLQIEKPIKALRAHVPPVVPMVEHGRTLELCQHANRRTWDGYASHLVSYNPHTTGAYPRWYIF